MRLSLPLRDEGRVPVGGLLTVGLLVAAGLAAWWFLNSFLGSGGESSETAGPTAVQTDSGPGWLAGSGRELPPLIGIDDDRLPEAHLMADWIWDFVNDQWSLLMVNDGPGDGSSSLTDIQMIYLVGPDETTFKLYDLRTDYVVEVVHWDPVAQLAWLRRDGRPGMSPVVQFDLVTGEAEEEWDGNAASSSNDIAFGIGNVAYIGDQPDGRELWGSYDESGFTTGVFWRTPQTNEFQESLISSEIRRLDLQGYSQDQGVDAWVDPATATAVYRATFRESNSRSVRMERWLLHDLATDTFTQVTPQLPSRSDCLPAGDLTSPDQFRDGRIVADCGSGVFLIDPTGEAAPEAAG